MSTPSPKHLFTKALAALNQAQREAVETIDGPVMVIAGPGTGKTQILTLRIANILDKTDTRPENILALTFTEAGARAMRERLCTYIGSAAYQVPINTFHEFAGNLIKQYPDAYDRAVGGRPASDLEKISIIEAIIESGAVPSLRPHGNPQFYVKPILSAIALLKREYITTDQLVLIIQQQEATLKDTPQIHEKGAHKGKVRGEYKKLEKELIKTRELLYVYQAYDASLSEQHLFDFEDMIFETVKALQRDEEMLRDLQERFHYLLADEHQDVNGSQNKILELLASFHERPNIFVVGDEKQAIFRFQGASLENFLFFEERFPTTKTIALTENYRSVQSILDLGHTLITQEDSPAAALRVALTAVSTEAGLIEQRQYGHEAIEQADIVDQISALSDLDVPLTEIAIIVRSNREVEEFAIALRAQGIPVRATADGDILYHPVTTAVLALLSAVIEPTNEQALSTVWQAPYWGQSMYDMATVLRARSYARPLSVLIRDEVFLAELALESPAKSARIVNVLDTARERLLVEAPHQVLHYLLSESGFIDHVMCTSSIESARVLRRLYDDIESLVKAKNVASMSDVVNMLKARREHTLPLNAPYINESLEAVQVMTAHKSKGLEFAHVFVPHLTEARWGDSKRPTYFKIPVTKQVDDGEYDSLDDERKLLYVACTRAKVGLYLSLAKQNSDGRPLLASPLLLALGDALPPLVDTNSVESGFHPLTSLHKPTNYNPLLKELCQSTLQERGVSATSLNNYLSSPWTYIYRNVLRIPDVKSEQAQFGTALHNTLRSITQYRTKHGSLPDAATVKKYLERELDLLPLSVTEYTRLHERGFSALLTYVQDGLAQTLTVSTREEVNFEARLVTGLKDFPEVLLTGSLDRLDYDESGTLWRVVDYKSGKPKTRGYIEGTTKGATGDYKRQLTFYALLLSLQADQRLHCREGLLSFVESDDKGVLHEESYIITNEEIEVLRLEIINMVQVLVNGTFIDIPCDPSVCDYCDLVVDLTARLAIHTEEKLDHS
jgi:DNA helicase-2/ATP-dependent DNA helicase PcrA